MLYQFQCLVCNSLTIYVSRNPRERLLCCSKLRIPVIYHAPSHENKIMEHEHILKWSNIERVIYCEDEECDYLINDRKILDIIKENQ